MTRYLKGVQGAFETQRDFDAIVALHLVGDCDQSVEELGKVDRRSFLASGAAVGAVAIAQTPAAQAAEAIGWDREVDVVVIGAGAGGLVAAIAAREKGASVLIVEKNFDIGGRAMMSYGGLYIGGGNFVHAPHTGDVVKISSLYDSWYAATYVGARRI